MWESKDIENEALAIEEEAAVENEAPRDDAPVDLDEAEDLVTSVSQIKPTASQISKMSGKTYFITSEITGRGKIC